MKKNKKIKVLIITFFLIGILTTVSFYINKKITSYSKTAIKEKLYDSLSAIRQENYDKMKIQYINIKNRVTGTTPFNTGTTSNATGIDVSANDNYVRTLDVMKYTVELGVVPNVDHEGVTENSSFNGGVIKVRAKLPNQGTPLLMTWEQDAWMENVTFSDDKTEIYAEYHVPENVIISNSNQNLSFTVKIGGYKRTVTSEMAPIFEIWMEGNKPDDPNSTASSITKKDNRQTIISGKYSFDFEVKASGLNNYEKRNGVEGHYISYGLYAALWQPYDYISDFRGVLYPTEKITVSLDGEMKYHYPDETTGWQSITGSSPGAANLINGTTLLAAKTNCTRDAGFYPAQMYRNTSYPGGSRACTSMAIYTVFNGGDTNGTLSNNKLTITFENYQFDGTYPEKTLDSTSISELKRRGIFAVANMEFYVPYYNPKNKGSFENQLIWTIKSAKVGTNSHTIGVNETYADGLNNNRISAQIVKRSGGIYSPIRPRQKNNPGFFLSSSYSGEDGAVLINDYFIIEAWTRASSGPYEGGFDNLITFNTNMFELAKYTAGDVNDPEKMYDVIISSDFGFPMHSIDKTSVKYGIYKANKSKGLTTNDLANNALYKDFDWYNTYSEASTKGKVTAIYCNDTGNKGNGVRTYFRFNIHALQSTNNIGKIGIFRMKTKFYDDQARTKISYFRNEAAHTSPNVFIPSEYDSEGNITSRGAPEEYGETILLIGVKTGIKLESTDLDSNNQMKKAYDVQENEIHLKLTPTFVNGKTPTDGDPKYNNIIVKAILPKGLSYKSGSASKTPKSVTQNTDGTTTIEWRYDNWQINHDPPSDTTINFTANISASLENNESLNIKANIGHVEDIRDLEKFRTSNYGVVISNLSGSRAAKTVDKPILDTQESFTITSTLGNNNEEILRNVRSIEFLPKNNDENGSKYSGDYTAKVISLATGQKMYYTTRPIDELNLPTDQYGNITAKGIELTAANGWNQIAVNGTIPSNATAIVTQIATIPAKSSVNYKIQISPQNNQKGDTYASILNMSSDNLATVVKSNIVVAKVAERRISGIVFEDENKNGLNDPIDKKLNNITVELLDLSSNLITTTNTDSGGYYEFSLDGPGSYYVRFQKQTGYTLITKGTDNNSSKVNTNYVTDIITHTAPTTKEVEYISNINMGLVRNDASLIVKYTDTEGNDLDSTKNRNETVRWFDIYTSEQYEFPNYEFVRIDGDPGNGVISKDNTVVNYIYQLKSSTITAHHYIDGTNETIHEDVIQTKKYTERYTTSKLDTTNLNYEYVRTDGDPETDIISKDSYTVNYYYKQKDATLVVKYVDQNGNDIDSTKNRNEQVHWGDAYVSTTLIFNNYSFVNQTGDNPNGVISKNNYEIIYHYKLKDATLVVKYVDQDGNDIDSTKNRNESVHYGDSYTSSELTFTNYNFVERTGDAASGTIEKDNVEVIYHYDLKPATLVVKYVDQDGNDIDSTKNRNESVHYGDSYTSSQLTFTNYNFVERTGDAASGTINKDSVEVVYHYTLKDATLVVKYVDESGNNIDASKNRNENVHWGETYSSEQLTFTNYNFVERTGDAASGTIGKNRIEVIYHYALKPATVTTHHYVDGTTNRIAEDNIQNKKYTDEYSTSKLNTTNLDYEYVRTDGDPESGTVSKDSYEINYYYKLKEATVITHHYLYDKGETTTKLAEEVSKTWNYTETYTTSVSDEVPKNYELYKKTDNFTGIVNQPSIEVSYYYQLKDSNLETSISKTGPEEITAPSEEVNYKITYNAKIKDYIGDGTITIVDTLPYKIDESKSNLAGGTYNADNQTITWMEEWNDINSYESNEGATKEIIKNITLVYTGIVGRDRNMINSIRGRIELSNNSRDTETSTSTNIRIKGNIKVMYLDKDTNEEIFDTIEKSDLVGERFISETKEKDGYKLVEKPETEEYYFEEEDQIIKYLYEHIKFEIKGVVKGDGGGRIKGDEEVYWGNDSTVNNIVIEAEKGYVIKEIYVNGDKLDIEPNQEKMILPNFENMLENKNIEVSFVSAPPKENPPTGSKLNIVLLLFGLMISIVILIKRKIFNKLPSLN